MKRQGLVNRQIGVGDSKNIIDVGPPLTCHMIRRMCSGRVHIFNVVRRCGRKGTWNGRRETRKMRPKRRERHGEKMDGKKGKMKKARCGEGRGGDKKEEG